MQAAHHSGRPVTPDTRRIWSFVGPERGMKGRYPPTPEGRRPDDPRTTDRPGPVRAAADRALVHPDE
ncbi:Protein of unknown function [Micromonospora lupini str. Lupac 08]|uniref:Uncharacterized protein n=1 Tax=Micromonospora lupini str. Lupac 08 TaxID=1150864 RepID=I0L6B1_9ACTN|nr:Protein of unknown function [Micromonospora lupini str. Lupac 08]